MNRYVVVAEFDHRQQAETLVNLLSSFGVPSRVVADDLGGIAPGQSFLQGVKVVVDIEDSERAREILGSGATHERSEKE
jgi:hypothetical protein